MESKTRCFHLHVTANPTSSHTSAILSTTVITIQSQFFTARGDRHTAPPMNDPEIGPDKTCPGPSVSS